MDATLDPFTGHVPTIRMARAGNLAGARRMFTADHGIPAALTGAISVNEYMNSKNPSSYVVYDEEGNPRQATREDLLIDRLGR